MLHVKETSIAKTFFFFSPKKDTITFVMKNSAQASTMHFFSFPDGKKNSLCVTNQLPQSFVTKQYVHVAQIYVHMYIQTNVIENKHTFIHTYVYIIQVCM